MPDTFLAIDFDGTICEHGKYPEVGDPVPAALTWLERFKAAGAHFILWTCRDSYALGVALQYLHGNGVEVVGVNENPDQKSWSKSPKAYAHLYIDDAAIGCPLIYPEDRRPYVDWSIVGPEVLEFLDRRKYSE